jgi:ATP synthase protein I
MRGRPRQKNDVIGRKAERRLRARSRRNGSAWAGLGLFGLVGWSVAVPTLLGTALGLWLDRQAGTGTAWTLSLICLGVVLGSLNAWHWIKKETRHDG